MRKIKSKREIYDIQIGGLDLSDAPDYADAYVTSAIWVDTGKHLTDEELDGIDDVLLGDIVYEYLF